MGKITYVKEFNFKMKDKNSILFELVDNADYEMYVGRIDEQYQIKLNKQHDNWKYRLFDFINYIKTSSTMNAYIHVTDNDLKKAKEFYISTNSFYKQTSLRDYEPEVLIHSTTERNYELIKSDGLMKCWNLIKEDNKRAPIGDLLGDPDEFKSYIMFGTGVTCEIVVASSDSGTIVWDVDSEYNPGVRLYFDGSKMAKDGILIRDGIHWKVKSKFSYKDYLLFEVTKELIDKNKLVWTPKQFTLQADNLFRQTIENKY